MCFTKSISAGLCLLGFASSAGLRIAGRPASRWFVFFYFGLMELLQLSQHMVVDDCDSKLNRLLTLLGWVHISLQPLVFNFYWWNLDMDYRPNRPGIRERYGMTMRLSLVAAVLLLLKGLPSFIDIPSELLLAPIAHCAPGSEMMCSSQLCCKQGQYHLAWHYKLLQGDYYIPSIFIHFFLGFFPILLEGTWPVKLIVLVSILMGPIALDAWMASNRAAHTYEFASTWCLMSVAQVVVAFAWELTIVRWMLGPIQQQGVRVGQQNGLHAADKKLT